MFCFSCFSISLPSACKDPLVGGCVLTITTPAPSVCLITATGDPGSCDSWSSGVDCQPDGSVRVNGAPEGPWTVLSDPVSRMTKNHTRNPATARAAIAPTIHGQRRDG